MFKIVAIVLMMSVATASADLPAPAKKKQAEEKISQLLVKDMHCIECARKIARKLYAVPGVRKVRVEVKTNRALIVPQKDKQPSPKKLWESVEKAGFVPVKLVGPAGSFTKKPPK